MKKWIALTLLAAMLLSLTACKKDKDTGAVTWKTLLEQGKEQMKTEPDKAVTTLEQALQKAPKKEQEAVYFALVDACVAAKDGKSAMQYYLQAEEAGWDNANLEKRWEEVRELYQTENLKKEQSLIESGELYTVTRKDLSVYNDASMKTGAVIYYDLLQFDSSLPQYASANELLQQDWNAFEQDIQQGFQNDSLEYAADAGYLLQDYIQTEVSYMDSDYICVLHTGMEWMGGRTTLASYAHVFSRKTGQQVNLGNILGNDQDALTALRQNVIDYMDSQGDIWLKNAYSQVRNMQMADFSFYLSDEGLIILVLDASALTSAIHGNVEIVYPVSLAELRK